MRPTGSPKALERRRRRAIALIERGLALKEVARRVRASFSSVFRWQQTVAQEGPAALKAKPVPGRPRKLRADECCRLLAILLEGALAYGFPNDLWTLKRIQTVIRKEFSVVYHPNHVWRLLRRAGWSCQVPERQAIQQDPEAIAHWKRYKWPQIKKGATTWGPSAVSR
jgi:transposase